MSLFKKPTPEEQRNKNLRTAYKKNERKRQDLETRQKKISECCAVLNECYNTFENMIIAENSRVEELRGMGFDYSDQRARVRNAAIGMLVAKEAMIKMRRINTEAEMASAMNRMGMALKQLQRLDDSNCSISNSTKKVLMQWYPYPLEANEADQAAYAQLVIPDEIRERVDDRFVTNLINGIPFDDCLLDSMRVDSASCKKMEDLEDAMAQINQVLSDDTQEMEKKVAEKFGNPF